MRQVVLPVDALGYAKQARAWGALMEIAPDLGDGWTLVGGQMVMLHQVERSRLAHGSPPHDLRLTTDLDVVVNIRAGRRHMRHIHETLMRHGFQQRTAQTMHRYSRSVDNVVVDVMAPDHLGSHLPRLGDGRTLQAVGATQALRRTEPVLVVSGSLSALIRRPSLVGALLMKIAVAKRVGPGGHRMNRDMEDVWRLAAMLNEADATSAALSRNERARVRWAAEMATRAALSGGGAMSAQGARGLQTFMDKASSTQASATSGRSPAAADPLAPIAAPEIRPCGKWMRLAECRCVLPDGHSGHCRSRRRAPDR